MFSFWHMDVQLFQHRLLKRRSIIIELAPLLKISWPLICGSVSALCSVPLICLTIFMLIPHGLDYCKFKKYIYIFKDFIYLFIFRDMGREGERGGEKH